ncbi:hypothetical protein Q9233_016940 [Columba guinea]|nr:hypothetical protein Q9233_016940 [Columba guinea]
MDAIVAFAGFLQTLVSYAHFVGDELDDATQERMQQRAEMLRREMTRLWQEIELKEQEMELKAQEAALKEQEQEQSSFAWRVPLLAALQQWQLWAVAGVLLLLFGLCCWFRKRSQQPASSGKGGSSRRKVDEEKIREKPNSARDAGRVSAKRHPDTSEPLTTTAELPHELLRTSPNPSRNAYMLRPRPIRGLGNALDSPRPQEDGAAMDAIVAFAGFLQTLVSYAHFVGDELDDATQERMQQRAEMLRREMTRLWQEIELKEQEMELKAQEAALKEQEQEQSSFAWGVPLLAALQQWQLWAVAGVLLLLFGLCCWLRKRSQQPASSGKGGSSRRKVDEEKIREKPNSARDAGRVSAKRHPDTSEPLTTTAELPHELLRTSPNPSRNAYMLRPRPVRGLGNALDSPRPQEDGAAMDAIVAFAGFLQTLVSYAHFVGDELDDATQERMQQRAEMLRREMTRLWQEVELKEQEMELKAQQTVLKEQEQEQSSFAWGVPLLAALQQWQLWAVAGVLLLLFGLCCWLRKRSQQPASSGKGGSSRRKVDEEKIREKPNSARDAGRVSAKRHPDTSEPLTTTAELPHELLRTSPNPSRNAYMLRPRPIRGLGNALDSPRPQEDGAAMDAIVAFAGFLQTLVSYAHFVGDELDDATQERMQQRAEMLRREMTRLWQEIELKEQEMELKAQEAALKEQEQEQSSFAWGVPLLAALQQWQLWAVAGVLLLLFGLCCWLRKRSQQPASSGKGGSSRRKVDEEKIREKPNSARDAGRVSAKRHPDTSEPLTTTAELPHELLRTSPNPSRNAYMLRPRPIRGLGNALDSPRPQEDGAAMDAIVAFAGFLQTLVSYAHFVGDELDDATQERMQQRAEMLRREMTRLWQEVELKEQEMELKAQQTVLKEQEQEQSSFAWGVPLLAALQQWQLWAVAGVLLLLFGLCCWLRKRSQQPASSGKGGSSRRKVDEEKIREKPNSARDAGRVSAKRHPDTSEPLTTTAELPHELLRTSPNPSRNAYMLRPRPVRGLGNALDSPRPQEDGAAMDAIVAFAGFLQTLVSYAHFVGDELDDATQERMQQRAEMLRREMTRLWQEVELKEQEMELKAQQTVLKEQEQEQSSFAWGVPLLAALQQWQLWAVAGVLLLLFGLCCWLRKRSQQPASSGKGGSSRRKVDEEKIREKPNSARDAGRVSAKRHPDTSEPLTTTAELPHELLRTSPNPSRNAYMLRPRPIRGLGNALDSPRPQEDGAAMDAIVAFAGFLQTLVSYAHFVGDELDDATQERMQQRAEMLRREMTRLWQEVELKEQEMELKAQQTVLKEQEQEQSSFAWGVPLLAALQQWQLWAVAGVLLLLFGLCCWLRKRSQQPASSGKGGSSRRKVDEEKIREKPNSARDAGRVSAKRHPDTSEPLTTTAELPHELLRTSPNPSRNAYMLRPRPIRGLGNALDSPRPQEDGAAMDAIVAFAGFLQTLVSYAHFVGDELDDATQERMQQRAEMLRREMTRLWQEVELKEQEMELKAQQTVLKEQEQEQSSFAWGVPLLAALQQWQLWAVAGVLLLLFGLCCWLRKRSQQPASSGKGGSSRRKVDEEKIREKPNSARDAGRVSAKRHPDTSEPLTTTAELPHELLRTSPNPSRNAYMLRPRPIRGLGNALDSPRPQEDGAAMDAIVAFAGFLQTLVSYAHFVGDELDDATQERMQQRAEMLRREMTRLWQEIELKEQEMELKAQEAALKEQEQEQSSFAWGVPLLAALQQWQLWAVAGVLLLLFGLCCWLRKRSQQPASSGKGGSSRRKVDEEKIREKPNSARDAGRVSAKRHPDTSEPLTTTAELPHELLRTSPNPSRNAYMLRPRPIRGLGNALDSPRPQEDGAAMDAIVAFAGFLQTLVSYAHFVGDELDDATQERMQHRAEMLRREMTRLWQEIELKEQEMELKAQEAALKEQEQEQSSFAWGVPLLAALQQWQLWAVAGVLLLLFGLCCWLRKRSQQPASSGKGGSSRRKVDEEKIREKPNSARDAGRVSAKRHPDTSEPLTTTAELPHELLRTSPNPSRNAYMLRPRPIRGLGNALDSPRPQEDGAAMDAIVAFAGFLQTLVSYAHFVGDELDDATQERMQQRAEMLRREMTRLWQEIELKEQEMELKAQEAALKEQEQEQSSFAWGVPLLAALQQWQLWAVAGVLLLLFGLCCWLRKRSQQPASSGKGGSSRRKVDEEKIREKPNSARDAGRVSAKRHPDTSEPLTTTAELPHELLRTSPNPSRNAYMLRPRPIRGLGNALDSPRPQEDGAVSRRRVPLKPTCWLCASSTTPGRTRGRNRAPAS